MNCQMDLMKLTKSCNKNIVLVGDVVTFKLLALNTSNIILGTVEDEEVYVYDVLPSELEFIEGSVKVNNIPSPDSDINAGINLGILDINESKVITFDAKVIKYNPISIINSASASFGYIVDNYCPSRGVVISNDVVLEVTVYSLDIYKTSDKEFVVLGDIITYTVKVTNSGLVTTVNTIFKDVLSTGTKMIDGSFKINSNAVNKVDLEKGINIGNIAPGCSTVLTYKVKVLQPNCSMQLENKASATFTVVLENGCTGKGESNPSSTSTDIINLGIANFKQISIEEYLKIPPQKPDVDQINVANASINIVKCHVVRTNKVKSIEGQILSGYKLIIYGMLKITIEYTACDKSQSVHSAHYDVPFSTFIVLPENYNTGSKMEVDPVVEDVYSKVVNCRLFFANITALINIKILLC